jgi:hypothetical protein
VIVAAIIQAALWVAGIVCAFGAVIGVCAVIAAGRADDTTWGDGT